MKDYNTLSRSLDYPAKPKKVEPKREAFPNNTEWGKALDQAELDHAADMAAYKVKLDAYHDKSNQLEKEFWEELYAEMGWDRLPKKIAQALQSRAWEEGHSSGYNEVYNCACDYDTLVDAILDELK